MESNLSPQSPPGTSKRNPVLVIVIIGIAIIAVGALILLTSQQAQVAPGDYADLEKWRQPDGGFVLGNPKASITLVEFADYS